MRGIHQVMIGGQILAVAIPRKMSRGTKSCLFPAGVGREIYDDPGRGVVNPFGQMVALIAGSKRSLSRRQDVCGKPYCRQPLCRRE